MNWKEWVEYIYPKLDEMAREDLEENAKKEFGAFDETILENPLWEKTNEMVSHLMYEYGPDRHTDGSDIISYYIISHFTTNSEEET